MAGKSKKEKNAGKGSRFVLMVGDEGAILVQMHKKRVVRRMFAQSPEPTHTRGFEDLLAKTPKAPITMIVDMMDQSYVRQTLPPVSSLSVGKIVRRRLDKDFARDDIKGYIVLGREKTGRRDWSYLMVSLANPSLMQKWISFAVERTNPFRGIGLVPLEAQPFIMATAQAYLKDKGKDAKPLEWQILVSHNKVGGFRQVVLKNGKLVFTRMAQPIGESNPEVIAGNVEQEMINTQEYLRRMGLQDPATLSATILVSGDIKQVLDPKNIKAGEVHLVTPFEMAELLDLKDAAISEDHFGDVIISAFTGRKNKLLLPLNTPYTKKLAKWSMFLKSLRAMAAATALGIIGWAGMMAWDWMSVRSEIEDVVHQQRNLRTKLDQIKVQAKSLPKQINTYTDVMTLTKILSKRKYDALSFTGDFINTLQGAAVVKAYHWSLPTPLGIARDGDKRQIQAEVDLHLTAPQQPRDAFITTAQSLLERIKNAFPDYEVTHSELPGMLSDSKELKTVIDETGVVAPTGESAGSTDVLKITIKGPSDKAVKNGH